MFFCAAFFVWIPDPSFKSRSAVFLHSRRRACQPRRQLVQSFFFCPNRPAFWLGLSSLADQSVRVQSVLSVGAVYYLLLCTSSFSGRPAFASAAALGALAFAPS